MSPDQMMAFLADGFEHGPDAVRASVLADTSGRPLAERRRYAERADPWAYIREILGWSLTPQQEEAIALVMEHDRVLIPSANNVGKTFLLAALAWYFYDAVAALPDEERGLEEQGCILLLPGPDHRTIQDTIYSEMLEHRERAESRGHSMPGESSERWPAMKVRARWYARAFSPPKSKTEAQAHKASGRHHRNMIAAIEEGGGVVESVWVGVEGMCSSAGNKIVSSFNPTEASGPAYDRRESNGYRVLHLSALDHPNVKQRRAVIGGALGHLKFEARLRSREVDDRGPAALVTPDENHDDFVYALPDVGVEDVEGEREDEIPGHPKAEPHVFRPQPVFSAQGLGRWPKTSLSGLFDPAAWDMAVQRWKAGTDPDGPPDRIGVDAAREGDDDTCCCPVWGRPAAELLEAWREIQRKTARAVPRSGVEDVEIPTDPVGISEWLLKKELEHKKGIEAALPQPGPVVVKSTAEEALSRVQRKHRARAGRIVVAPKGDGPTVGMWIADRFPDGPYIVDEGGVGASVFDYLGSVLGLEAMPVAFGARALPKLENEQITENMRTQMHLRAAALVRLGLIDIPPDPMLRQEAMAQSLKHVQRADDSDGRRRMRPAVRLASKDDVKEKIGRSPDRLDAFVLGLLAFNPGKWSV